MTYYDIVEDMLRQYPDFFIRYEELAQIHYKYITANDTYAIPRAHCNALLELLTQAGYRISKVTTESNVTSITPNVLKFRKGD